MNYRWPHHHGFHLMTAVMPDGFNKDLSTSDILLASFPESGNTWMRLILANIVSLMELDGREVDYHFLNGPMRADLDINEYGEMGYHCITRFVKTYKEYDQNVFGTNKSVYILRNPGDTMVSYFEYQRGLKDGIPDSGSFSEFIRSNEYGIDAWCRHISSWAPVSTVYLTYEMLKVDPLRSIRDMFRMLGLPGLPESIVRESVRRSDFKAVRKLEEQRGLNKEAQEAHKPGFKFTRDGSTGQWVKFANKHDIEYINQRLSDYGWDAFQLRLENADTGISEPVLLDSARLLLNDDEWGRAGKILEQNALDGENQEEVLLLKTLTHYKSGDLESAISASKQLPNTSIYSSVVGDLENKIQLLSKSHEGKVIQNVRRKISEEDYIAALNEINLIDDQNTSIELLYLSGLCHYRKGNIHDSVVNLRRAVSIDSNFLPARELLHTITSEHDLGDDETGRCSNNRVPVSPITGSDRVNLVRSVKTSYLIQEYWNQYKIDVGRFFKNLDKVDIYKCIDTGFRFYYPFDLAGDGKFYEDLQHIPWYYMDWKWEHEAARKIIEKGQKVLEVGCGNGGFLKQLGEEGIEAVGLELNEDAVEKGKKKGLSILPDDIESYALAHEKFYDVVCSFQVVEHIPLIRGFLNASIKALKPGGTLLVSVPNHDSVFGLGDFNLMDVPPHHMGLWDEHSLIQLGSVLGLKLNALHIEPLQEYHIDFTIQIMKKRTRNDLGLHEAIEKYLRANHKRLKGYTIMAEYQKPEVA